MGTDWDRVKRLFGKRAFEYLLPKTVAVIGAGSVGSYGAELLTMCGVGNFILVDPDHLEGHNIVRHAANLRHVGQAKVKAVADLLHQRNPRAKVKLVVGDVLKNLACLEKANLVLVCVDSEPVKQQINMALLRMKKVALYAGVHEKGRGGDVCIVYPDQGACYACLAQDIRGMVVKDQPQDLDYGIIGENGTLQGEPGLGIHVIRVTVLLADWALRVLLIGSGSPLGMPDGNVALVSNDVFYDTVGTDEHGKPIVLGLGQTEWFSFPENRNCRICHPPQFKERVKISELL